MGQYQLSVDPNATDTQAVQDFIDKFMSLPGSKDFLSIPTLPGGTILITDNPQSNTFNTANRTLLKNYIDSFGYTHGFSQENGTKLKYINLSSPDGKNPLNILVHEIGHAKWPELGKNENQHDPSFYKLLNDTLGSLGLSVDKTLDLQDVDIANVKSPAGDKSPLTYSFPRRRTDIGNDYSIDLPTNDSTRPNWITTISDDGSTIDEEEFNSDKSLSVQKISYTISSGGITASHASYPDGSTDKQIYDVDNQKPYSLIDQTYRASGALDSQKYYQDDGSIDKIDYDPDGTKPYTNYTSHYDPNGSEIFSMGVNHSGGRDYNVYDSYNQNPWSWYGIGYDPKGNLSHKVEVSDDGSMKDEIFLRAQNGGTNDPNLPDRIDFFDTTGRLVRQQNIAYSVVAGTNGPLKLAKLETVDTANLYSWNSIVQSYSRKGKMDYQTTVMDDGTTGNYVNPSIYTNAWNFSQRIDSNEDLISHNPYAYYEPNSAQSQELELPILNSYDPLAYYATPQYDGYKGIELSMSANTDPIHNMSLIS